jgi:hypothetical protein
MSKKEKIIECKNGESHYVCWDCASKYRDREPYDGTYTQHNGTCYICEKEKPVASSRKLFGFHKFI